MKQAGNISGHERLLVFIVAYQAESTLKDVLDRISRDLIDRMGVEILIVDDASVDRTFEIGREYSAAHPELPLTVLRNEYNQGYGGNQKIGYLYASTHGFDYVALVHGDGQYAPELLDVLVEPLVRGDADAVFGSRMMIPGAALVGGMPPYKYIGNRVLTTMQNTLLNSELSEFHSGYRVYRVAALDRIHYELNTNDFHFDTQIILQLMNSGGRIVELPIPTYYGEEISRVNGIRYAFDVMVNTAGSFFHKLGLFQQRRLDPIGIEESQKESRLEFASTHSMALAAVTADSNVIDLGARPGHLASALQEKGCSVTLVDLVSPAPWDDRDDVIVADLNEPFEFSVRGFDTILLLDVIEHLADPEDFLVRLREQFDHSPKTLVLSTPNVAFVAQRLALMLGQFNYGRNGILDRGHTRLFTFRTLKHLLRDAGFRIKVVRGVPAPYPLVAGKGLGGMFVRINEMLIRVSRTLFSFQIFVVAESTPSVSYLVDSAKRSSR